MRIWICVLTSDLCIHLVLPIQHLATAGLKRAKDAEAGTIESQAFDVSKLGDKLSSYNINTPQTLNCEAVCSLMFHGMVLGSGSVVFLLYLPELA